jgi:hypothetical protein
MMRRHRDGCCRDRCGWHRRRAWGLSHNQSSGNTDATYRDTLMLGIGICTASTAALGHAILQWTIGRRQYLPSVSAARGGAMIGSF